MTCQCIRCDALDLKGSDLGRMGWGLCKLRANQQSKATMVSTTYKRECAKFEEAPAATIELRESLLRKEGIVQ